jgi:hypothetical protein
VVRTFADERDLRISVPLSELVSGQDVSGFAADVLFPPVAVPNRTGYAQQISPEDWRGIESAVRAPGTKPKLIAFNVQSAWYQCRNYAYTGLVTFEDRENADALSIADATVSMLRNVCAVGKERRALNTITASGNVSSMYVPNSAWNSGGDPIAAITTMISAVQSASGFRPTLLYAGGPAWETLKTNTLAKNSIGGFVTPTRLGEFLRVDVRVADGFQAELTRFGGWKNPADDAVGVFVQQGKSGNDFFPRFACSPYWRPPGVRTRFSVEQKTDYTIHADRAFVDNWETELILDKNLGAILRGVNSAQGSGI